MSLKSYTSRRQFLIELQVFGFVTAPVFFVFSEQGIYYSNSILYSGMRKLFRIDHLPSSSDRTLYWSHFFLENCGILAKIGTKTFETMKNQGNTVKLSGTQ